MYNVFAFLVDFFDGWAPWIQWQFATGFDEVNATLNAYFKAQIPNPPKSKEQE